MKLDVPKGKFVVAVSGGVDSIVLLDMLSNLPGVELIVAHFNHGIRDDSILDEKLVTKTAKKYGLPLEIGRANLGKDAREEQARSARYTFLHQVKEKHAAKAIITAHHQDDLIETAFINLLRGTGRRGISALANNPETLRPLLEVPKSEIIEYAKKHKLEWREDETNKNPRYLRNYIRINILPKLSLAQRKQLLKNIDDLKKLNPILDQEIATLSQATDKAGKINRQRFINLPSDVSKELLIYSLRDNGLREIDKKLVDRLATAVKTAKPGTKHNIYRGAYLLISTSYAQIVTDVN